MNIMVDLSSYLGFALEHDKLEGVVIMTLTSLVDSLVNRFDKQYETRTSSSVEFGIGLKRCDNKEDDRLYK